MIIINNFREIIWFIFILIFSNTLSAQNSGQKRAEYQLNPRSIKSKFVLKYNPAEIFSLFVNTQDTFQIDGNLNFQNSSYVNLKNYLLGYLVNTSNQDTSIITQDMSLFMILEAKNETNKWRPIEYWVWSDCGNSYEDFELKKNHQTSFKVPLLTGKFKTKLRLKLIGQESKFIYSNEFEGSIDINKFIIANKKDDIYIEEENKYLGKYEN